MNISKNICLAFLTLLLTSAGLSAQVMYPGDVNNSGQANAIDVLYLGLAFGSEGPERFSPTTSWMPQSIAPSQWSQTFPNGINYAYADCNGDGIVDQLDLEEGIQANFLLEHGGNTTSDEFTGNGGLGSDPGFALFGDKEVLFGSDTLNVDVRLGAFGVPVQEFYGIAFTVTFDPALIEGDQAHYLLPSMPWYDPTGSESTHLVMENVAEGRIDVAITRIDQLGIDGSGTIGSMSFVIIEDVVGEFVLLDSFLHIENLKLINSALSDVQVYDTVQVELTPVTEAWEPEWRIFPNPARELVYLETGDLEVQRITIHNALGQQVRQYLPPAGQQTYVMPTDGLPGGTYFLEIATPKGRWVRKLMIQQIR
jgi:hypothetical protein